MGVDDTVGATIGAAGVGSAGTLALATATAVGVVPDDAPWLTAVGASAVAVAVGALGVAVGVGVLVGVAVAVGVGVMVGVAVAVAVGDGEGVGVGKIANVSRLPGVSSVTKRTDVPHKLSTVLRNSLHLPK